MTPDTLLLIRMLAAGIALVAVVAYILSRFWGRSRGITALPTNRGHNGPYRPPLEEASRIQRGVAPPRQVHPYREGAVGWGPDCCAVCGDSRSEHPVSDLHDHARQSVRAYRERDTLESIAVGRPLKGRRT